MLCTVSTVLDSVENIEWFVDANLRMGVDHMFVCVDWPDRPGQREIIERFAEHPHVTVVACDDAWWAGAGGQVPRPTSLNRRQIVNANIVLFALKKVFDEPVWLFHIDADEVLALHPDALAELEDSVAAVALRPAEAVSVFDADTWETRFKTIPGEKKLQKFVEWGILSEPNVREYFHGHVRGKTGVRVGAGVRLGLHTGLSPDNDRYLADWLPRSVVLHHHTRSGEAALAKAMSFALNDGVGLQDEKSEWVDDLQQLATITDPEERQRRMREVFDTHLADPVELLEQQHQLLHLDVRDHHHTPPDLDPETRALLERRLLESSGRRRKLYCIELPEHRRNMFGVFPGAPPRGLQPSLTSEQAKELFDSREARLAERRASREQPTPGPLA